MKAKFINGELLNKDEWSEVYDATYALLARLDKLTFADRDICLKEYLALHKALDARGTKEYKPL